MPWKLTTPVSVGDLDDADYDQVSITKFMQDPITDALALELQYGRTVDGVWVRGVTPKGKVKSIVISGEDYGNLIAGAKPDVQAKDPGSPLYFTAAGVWVEHTYVAVKRDAYQWLADKGHIGAGSIA